MKKSLKVLLCAMVILSLALPQMIVLAEGELPVLTNSYVMFANAAGAISALTPNETISVTTAVQNSGGSGEVMFSLAKYLNGTLIGVDIESSSVNKGEEKEFAITTTIGETTAGLVVKAFVWYKNSIEPISPIAVFPSSNSSLKNILVNGVALSGFSNDVLEYSYTLSANEKATLPKVTALANDNGAKITVTDPTSFPGKTVVTVTSPDKSITKTFNINYIAQSGVVSNFEYKGPTTTATSVVAQNFNNGDYAFGDSTTHTISSVKSQLASLPYIRTCINYNYGPASVSDVWKSATLTDWLQFNINQTAEVMVFTYNYDPQFATTDKNWVKQTDTNGYFYLQNNGSNWLKISNMFTKEFIVAPGGTTTVTLQNPGMGTSFSAVPYTVLIRYKYASPIANFKYLGPTADTSGGNKWTDSSYVAQNLQNGQDLYSDRQNTSAYYNINDVMDLKGNYFIKTMNDYNNASGGLAYVSTAYKGTEIKPWFSFDLRQTADVIIVSDNFAPAFATAENGWVPLTTPAIGYFLCRISTSNKYKSMVVKEFQATPSAPVTVTLNNVGHSKNGTAYTVIVRFK